MPLWKCKECHHEWEGDKYKCVCDWCVGIGEIIEEMTPFEKFLKEYLPKARKRIMKENEK